MSVFGTTLKRFLGIATKTVEGNASTTAVPADPKKTVENADARRTLKRAKSEAALPQEEKAKTANAKMFMLDYLTKPSKKMIRDLMSGFEKTDKNDEKMAEIIREFNHENFEKQRRKLLRATNKVSLAGLEPVVLQARVTTFKVKLTALDQRFQQRKEELHQAAKARLADRLAKCDVRICNGFYEPPNCNKLPEEPILIIGSDHAYIRDAKSLAANSNLTPMKRLADPEITRLYQQFKKENYELQLADLSKMLTSGPLEGVEQKTKEFERKLMELESKLQTRKQHLYQEQKALRDLIQRHKLDHANSEHLDHWHAHLSKKSVLQRWGSKKKIVHQQGEYHVHEDVFKLMMIASGKAAVKQKSSLLGRFFNRNKVASAPSTATAIEAALMKLK